jgi:hypothetical protein
VDDHIAGDAHSITLKHSYLPVNGKVIDVFPNKEMSEESGCWKPSDKRSGRSWRNDWRKVSLVLTAELWPDDVAFEKFGWNDVEHHGDLLADTLEGIRIGSDKVRDDLSDLDREIFQSGDTGTVGAALLWRFRLFSGV